MLATYGLYHYRVRSLALDFGHLVQISESLGWRILHRCRQRLETKHVPVARRAEDPAKALECLVKPPYRLSVQVRREEVQRGTTPAESDPHLVDTFWVAAQSRPNIGNQVAERSTD